MIDTAECPWCGTDNETTLHALVHCCRVQELWAESRCESLASRASEDWRATLLEWSRGDPTLMHRAAFLLWNIWQERNEKVFQGSTTPNGVILTRVTRQIMEQHTYAKQVYRNHVPRASPSSNVWQPPPARVIKFNADASVSIEGWIGMGVVARNEKGVVLLAAVRRARAWWSPEVAESRALLFAIKLAKKYGYEAIILESDSQVLISRLSKAVIFMSDFDSVLEDILSFSSGFSTLIWSHVRRGGNYVAHHLAKIVPFRVEQVWENHCPAEISPYVLSDELSFD